MRIIKRTRTLTVMSMLFLMCAMHTAGAMTVYVNDTSGVYGATVDIPINVSGAPEVGAMDISLTYNSSVLTALGAVNGSLTAGVLVMDENTLTKPYPNNWTDADFTDEVDNQTVWDYGALANNNATNGVVNISIISRYGFNGTGPVAVVRFEVIESGGAVSPLTLSTVAAYNLSAPYNNSGYIPDTVNITDGYDPIYNTTEDGMFTVTGDGGLPQNGDIDDDGDVDLFDAIHLAKYATGAGSDKFRTIHADGDIDSDGDVDLFDAIHLAKYATGAGSDKFRTIYL
jgi:hypothetical protein